MRALAATNMLSYELKWRLHLEWTEDQRYLSVEIGLHNTLENRSQETISATYPWLVNFHDGRPAPYLRRYEATVTFPPPEAGSARRVESVIASAAQLKKVNGALEAGGLLTHASGLETLSTPPGGQITYAYVGVTFHDASSILPLVTRYPTLRQGVTIGGPAVDDLDISVALGVDELQRTVGTDGDEVMLGYETNLLSIRGSTIRVQWARKRSTS